ncbi:zinc finger MYND domain-containing protein 15 isoform X3 [Accipiter gentilis]|uniref:zinc finger MYND domain-containing protein 15 isoform X3 n=1 Tax=Astur gentilis TaxID=8957 RepID=UPI002110BD32|nr:zinc finger MYND domain-containing protein 15 isoform X3 [Accipiter gentilis]
MEFLTGYRAELLELVSLVLGWRWGARGTPPKPGALRRLPPEPGPWVLHALPNARLGVALPAGGAWRGGGPSGDPRGPLCGDTALTLPDLCRTLTFISLEEEEEEEEEEGGGGGRPGQVLVVTWVLLLTDARGAPLGFDFELGSPRAPPAPPPARRALALLCRAMGCPMAGGPPRRPRQLDVGDAGLHTALQPAAARLGVTLVGTHLRGWGPPPTLGTPALRSRLCHACRGLARTPLPCPQCRAVLYCSEGCRAAEALGVHRGWCRQLGGFMGRTAALAQLPFTFTAEVTSETFDKERFLGARGLSRGGWAHLSMLVRAPDYGVGLGEDCHPLGTPHDLPFEGLQPAGEVSLPPAPSEPPPPNSFFSSWQQYYAWRGLPLSSPLAALLSYPLSLYYIVTSLVPQHFPELNILRKRSLRVQVEESGRELQLVGLFWELSVLLPHVSLELLFLGGSVPPPMDGRRFLLHHMEVQELLPGTPPKAGGPRGVQVAFSTRPGPRPDLVVGFNPGFALKESWLSALPRLQRVPAYFAEGGEYGCTVARAAVGVATGGGTGPPLLNPFRCPFRQPGLDNALPWYANAFIFQLLYKGGGGGGPVPPRQRPPPPHSPPASPPRERRRDKRPPRRRR